MSKNGKENNDNSNIVKGGALANHDTVNISEDKKPLVSPKPPSNENSGNKNGRPKKN